MAIIIGNRICLIIVYGTAGPEIEPFEQFLMVVT